MESVIEQGAVQAAIGARFDIERVLGRGGLATLSDQSAGQGARGFYRLRSNPE